MKISHKALIILLNLLVFFLLAAPNASGNTTLGDSTFPSEDGDYYIWSCINSTGDNHNIGDLTKFIVEFVYNESFEGKRSLIVNYSVEEYDIIGGSWIRNQDNIFYMAYNNSLNFLNWSSISYKAANLFLIPIPTNLTLVGDAIKSAGFLNYYIDNNKLILDYGNLTTVEITMSSLGVSTVIESITNGSTIYKWELNEDEVIIIIPMGNYFLFFGVLTSSMCLLLVKRKLDKNEVIH
ncbi:MAG: hypothetical protein KGD73_11160 [Candidatus Lokiarchaeota archaeon]|nr:hypothetical protein [Candidatus Lokiarchaeota archaeon]